MLKTEDKKPFATVKISATSGICASERIKHQTTYRVDFSNAELIESAWKNPQNARYRGDKIHSKVKLEMNETGISTNYRSSNETAVNTQWAIPDLLSEIQKKTGLTRATLCKNLQKSDRLQEVFRNPQRFIDLIAEKINLALQQIMTDGVNIKIAGKPMK